MSEAEAAAWRELIRVAERDWNGHLTILKFSTNWRIGFRTPNDRSDVGTLFEGETFLAAAQAALSRASKVSP